MGQFDDKVWPEDDNDYNYSTFAESFPEMCADPESFVMKTKQLVGEAVEDLREGMPACLFRHKSTKSHMSN